MSIKNGLTWKQLAPENVIKELGPLKWNDLENMTCESLFKNVRNTWSIHTYRNK